MAQDWNTLGSQVALAAEQVYYGALAKGANKDQAKRLAVAEMSRQYDIFTKGGEQPNSAYWDKISACEERLGK